jgi:hypothetical protein
MKTFKNFYEDTRELRQQLGSIDKEEEATRNLEARRIAAKRRADELAGTNDTEERLKKRHRSSVERDDQIRSEIEAQREKRSQKTSGSTASSISNAVKAGAKIALKTGKNLVKRIKNKVTTNPQSSS